MENSPIIWWGRRDFRLADNPCLWEAAQSGAPIIPVFLWDDHIQALGAAPCWRLGKAIESFAARLESQGSRLILRKALGPDGALGALQPLLQETKARAVYWSRAYEPAAQARDAAVKTALKASGVEARSFPGHVLFEPWQVQTKSGGFYKVFTPMWKALRGTELPPALPAPERLAAPQCWPGSIPLAQCQPGEAMQRGAEIVAPYAQIGEANAAKQLQDFLDHRVQDYPVRRDLPALNGTSQLSENLSLGEISPLQCWHRAQAARQRHDVGAEAFLRQLMWRDFAYHLTHHSPHILTRNWREEWDGFAWNSDETHPHVLAWKQGRTGVPFVDAAMRELYVTGRMHNRGRMIVGSYLTKHLLCDWRIGLRWFEECLIDWDPACNAMGWQWCAGSGPDAAPYFRVFNPETQAEKFDRDQRYRRRWIAELYGRPSPEALSYFEAIPKSWGLGPTDPYPAPIVSAADGRKRALAAYEAWKLKS
ncbi:MAG: DNA photolyase family protein [Mangrovicoccus sp.]|nr:DNA photolyase family protein [Mangrovicoccus sp.]